MFLSIMLTFWAFSFYYVGFHEILTNNISILLYVWTVCFQNICSRFYFLIYSIRLCFLSFLSKHLLHHVICFQRSHLYLLTWTLASFMHILLSLLCGSSLPTPIFQFFTATMVAELGFLHLKSFMFWQSLRSIWLLH